MEISYIEDFKLPYSYNIKPMKSYKPTPQKDPPKQQGDDVKILGNGNNILEEVDASFESGTNHYSYSYKVKFENGGKTNIYIEWDKNIKIDIGVFGSEGNKLDSPADNAPKKNSNGDNVQLCHVMYVKPGEEYLITLDIEKLENRTTDYTIDIKPCDNIPKYQNIGYNRDTDIYNNELESEAISSFDRRLNASEARIEERDRLSGVGGKIDKENQTQKTPEEILMELDISAAMKSVDELDGASNGIEVATNGMSEGEYWQLEYEVAHYGRTYDDVVAEAEALGIDVEQYAEFIKTVYTMPGTVGFNDGLYDTQTYYYNDTIWTDEEKFIYDRLHEQGETVNIGVTSVASAYIWQQSLKAQDLRQLRADNEFHNKLNDQLNAEYLIKETSKANFASAEKLKSHFKKHGTEFKGAYNNADEYLQGARDVMQNGTKVSYNYKGEGRTGYVKFMGNSSKGMAKFEFVGTNNLGDVTTYHVESGKTFWKMLNGENIKIINPID